MYHMCDECLRSSEECMGSLGDGTTRVMGPEPGSSAKEADHLTNLHICFLNSLMSGEQYVQVCISRLHTPAVLGVLLITKLRGKSVKSRAFMGYPWKCLINVQTE